MLFDIRDHGALGDGVTLSTASIQQAVDAAAVAGGTVLVPPGTWLTGTLVLKSNVVLELSAWLRW